MLAERPLPRDIDRRIEALARGWALDQDIAGIHLFGSRAQGQAGARSDVDLAVVLREDLDPDARWHKRLALIGDACRRLDTDAVDVIVLEDAPTVLAQRVLARGRLLHGGESRRRARVAEDIMRRYLDEAHLRAVLDDALDRRLSEGRFGR